MNKIIRLIITLTLTSLFFVGCQKPEPVITTELKAYFASETFSVEPGKEITLPFTVTGVDKATLSINVESDNSDSDVKVDYDENYQGNVTFTAPEVSDGQTVTVTLTVSDAANSRETTAKASVNVTASEPLVIEVIGNYKSMAVKPGGSFKIPFIVKGLNGATMASSNATCNTGWTTSIAWNEPDASGNPRGEVTVTAPASISNSITLVITYKDSYNRTAELSIPLTIIEITNSPDAANCYIVAPGSKLTIKAVKGNSTQDLTFNNASLVWQDQLGMVKSVSANSTEKVLVVELNAGVSGNAVVAAQLDSVIVWSWHVWVTDFNPDSDPMVYTSSSTSKTYTFMDRNLGATEATKYSVGALGLLYQWGRKDPFVNANGVESSVYVNKYDIEGTRVREVSELRPTYPDSDYESTNLELSIANPNVFYYAPGSAWPVVDWLTNDAQRQDNDLWGGVSSSKTIYDPCPQGWKVPASGDAWSFRTQYKKEGDLNSAGKYDPSYPWYIEYDDAYCIGFRYKAAGSEKEYWFPFSGKKDCNSGVLSGVGGGAQYHTTINSNTTVMQEILAWGNPASETGLNRPYGASIRCIKE